MKYGHANLGSFCAQYKTIHRLVGLYEQKMTTSIGKSGSHLGICRQGDSDVVKLEPEAKKTLDLDVS